MTQFLREITEERYYDMLGAVPPAAMRNHAFLLGEADSFKRCSETGKVAPSYRPFFEIDGKFFEANPVTIAEFGAIR